MIVCIAVFVGAVVGFLFAAMLAAGKMADILELLAKAQADRHAQWDAANHYAALAGDRLKEIQRLKALIAPFDHDGDQKPGGSRPRSLDKMPLL